MPIPTPAQLDQLAADIKQVGRDLGFAKLGIAATDLEADERRLERWLALGRHGTMSYMERHGRKRSRPAELVPGTIRVISARMSYWSDTARDARAALADPTTGYVARYALGRDYHKVLRKQLQRLAAAIAERAGEFGNRVFVDSAPVLEKALARDAGLGWIGKHTNLLDRDGSWFLLGELYTDLPLPADAPVAEHCGSCRACLDVCPTQAIVAPYELDARRCISYLTIELKGSIPEDAAAGHRQPHLRLRRLPAFLPVEQVRSSRRRSATSPSGTASTAAASSSCSHGPNRSGEARTAGSALRRAGYPGWLRNIAVALGNAPADARVVAALEARADDVSAIVREHVHWALARQRAGRRPLGLPTPSLPLVERAP